tara:strand:- start:158 stop:457 length:300 start_codon:yes stop_codon:yes gene_type:complete
MTLKMTEKELTRQVVQEAKNCGWLVYHTFLSVHSKAGFPDLCLVRPPYMLMAELKSDEGTVKPAQEEWLGALKLVTEPLETYLWRPSSLEDIYRRLVGL